MKESFLQENFAERVGGNKFGKDTTIYKFEKIKRAKRAAQAAKPDVKLIDMGVGEPDEAAFPEVIEALAKEAKNWENRTYTDNGIAEFTNAACKYMKELYNVDLCPEKEIVHAIGSKSALSLLPACFNQSRRHLRYDRSRLPRHGNLDQIFSGRSGKPSITGRKRLPTGYRIPLRGSAQTRQIALPQLPQQPDRGISD